MKASIRTLTLGLISTLGVGHAASGQKTVFDTPAKPRPATVSIMALASAVHRGFSGNQDVYLADVEFKGGDHQIARVVDFYPFDAYGIRRAVLTSRRNLTIRLVRTPVCDMPSRDELVGAREANIFDASLRSTLDARPDTPVPCYQTVHDSTRLAKK